MAIFGQGVQVQVGDGGGPENFTAVPGARDVAFVPPSRDKLEVTSHSSASGNREFIPGLMAESTIKFDIYWNPAHATHTRLWTLSQGLVNGNFKLIFPDPQVTTFAFAAQVKMDEIKGPVTDALTMTVTLTVSGTVTKTP
jgi:predicted secreted protein